MTVLVLLLLLQVVLCHSIRTIAEGEFPGPDRPWIEPSDSDLRSPCPAINTLANHGFINRNGRNISEVELAQNLSNNFGVSYRFLLTIARAAVNNVPHEVDGDGNQQISLDALFGKPDHDASMTRLDKTFAGEPKQPLNLCLIDELLHTGSSNEVLTAKDVKEFQKRRVLDSLKNNPDTQVRSPTNASAQFQMAGERNFIMLIGDGFTLSSVNKTALSEWLIHERFPVGYKPVRRNLAFFARTSKALIEIRQWLREDLANVPDEAMCL
jgi:hypothetical protein